MFLQETVLCATASTSSNAASGSITVHDFQTGSVLASFKQTNASPHCVSFVGSSNGQGGFILASQPEKPILNVYNFQKDQIVLKNVLPEKLTCTALDPQGQFFAGGTAKGSIYLWEVASGILFNTWDAHYRKITVLKFSHDGEALISGSEDSAVSVWSVSRLLDEDQQSELVTSYTTLSDHTLPITDIVCGIGPFPALRILTSSIDHSVKVWDLASTSLLTTFHYPEPISHLEWDKTERVFFAASRQGTVYNTSLFQHPDENTNERHVRALGGGGTNDLIRFDDDSVENKKARLVSTGHEITCLSLSLTSSHLLVGSATGIISIFDIQSRQLIRTITTHKGSSISYLATLLKPPDLVGHISLSLNLTSASDAKDVIPVKPVVAFQRVRDTKARQAHEISILLPAQSSTFLDEVDTYTPELLIKDHAYFVSPKGASSTTSHDPLTLQNRVNDLEAEVIRLREQLGTAKGVNDMMWENLVQRVIRKEGDASPAGIENDGGAARRKRQRE